MQPEMVELQQIASENGGILRPKDVVEYARDKKTALHSSFIWDDTKAAHEYRLYQARQLIRVRVTLLDVPGDTRNVRAFVSLKSERYNRAGGGYRAIVDVMSDEELRARMLSEALEEMAVFQEKYKILSELADVFNSMKRVRRRKKQVSKVV